MFGQSPSPALGCNYKVHICLTKGEKQMTGDKKMNHGSYQKNLRTKDIAALHFIIKDAGEAIAANPDNPNNGYYADEIHYAYMELKRRKAA